MKQNRAPAPIDQQCKEGFCAAIKACQGQVLLDNSKDLGDNAEATLRRNTIVRESKADGCENELVVPFAK